MSFSKMPWYRKSSKSSKSPSLAETPTLEEPPSSAEAGPSTENTDQGAEAVRGSRPASTTSPHADEPGCDNPAAESSTVPVLPPLAWGEPAADAAAPQPPSDSPEPIPGTTTIESALEQTQPAPLPGAPAPEPTLKAKPKETAADAPAPSVVSVASVASPATTRLRDIENTFRRTHSEPIRVPVSHEAPKEPKTATLHNVEVSPKSPRYEKVQVQAPAPPSPEVDGYETISVPETVENASSALPGPANDNMMGRSNNYEVIVRYYGRRPGPGAGAQGVADALNQRAWDFSSRWRFSPLPEEQFAKSENIYLINVSCRLLANQMSPARFDNEVRDLRAWLHELGDHDNWYPASTRPLAWMIRSGPNEPSSVYDLSLLAGADIGEVSGRDFATVGGDLARPKATFNYMSLKTMDQAKTELSSCISKQKKVLASLAKFAQGDNKDVTTTIEDKFEFVMTCATLRRSELELQGVIDRMRQLKQPSRKMTSAVTYGGAACLVVAAVMWWNPLGWIAAGATVYAGTVASVGAAAAGAGGGTLLAESLLSDSESLMAHHVAASRSTDTVAALLALGFLETPCEDGGKQGQGVGIRLKDSLTKPAKERLYEQLAVQIDLIDNEAYVAGVMNTEIRKACQMHQDWLKACEALL